MKHITLEIVNEEHYEQIHVSFHDGTLQVFLNVDKWRRLLNELGCN